MALDLIALQAFDYGGSHYPIGAVITDPAIVAGVEGTASLHGKWVQFTSTGGGATTTPSPTPTVSGGSGGGSTVAGGTGGSTGTSASGSTTGTSTAGTGAGLTAAQAAALANEPNDAAAIASQATQIASLQAALAATPAGASTSGTLAATGSGQSDAAALPYAINVVTSVASGAGVVLSGQAPQTILNRGANALLVYPPTGSTIAANPVNAPVQIVSGGTDTLAPTSSTQIYPE